MKPTYRSLKVRLKPRNNQEKLLWQSSGTARWAYNHCLDKQIKNYAENKTFLSNHDIRKQITQLKKRRKNSPWLSNVSAQIPKQAIKDCCAAYVNFFKKKSSFPRFKSKKKSKPSFYVDNHKIKFSYKKVYVEKIGYITLAEFGRIPFTEETKYSNPRITFDGKYWYVSVGIKITEFSEEKQRKKITLY
jgi:Probable transposase.